MKCVDIIASTLNIVKIDANIGVLVCLGVNGTNSVEDEVWKSIAFHEVDRHENGWI
jgi:hypothetical protein